MNWGEVADLWASEPFHAQIYYVVAVALTLFAIGLIIMVLKHYLAPMHVEEPWDISPEVAEAIACGAKKRRQEDWDRKHPETFWMDIDGSQG